MKTYLKIILGYIRKDLENINNEDIKVKQR